MTTGVVEIVQLMDMVLRPQVDGGIAIAFTSISTTTMLDQEGLLTLVTTNGTIHHLQK